MPVKIEQDKYRMPLCPYLIVGNRRLLVHLDAYCVPQSLQWPRPGFPDRLSWRDPFDEWPYWEEMSMDAIRARMPYFEYADGSRDYLHDAKTVEAGYIEDTNVLEGRYELPGGTVVEITTFVPPQTDVWVRQFNVTGNGKLVLQGDFFEKAVRGHALVHMGNVNFRGAFDAIPRGVYVIMSTIPLTQHQSRVAVTVTGKTSWTLFMCMAPDIEKAAKLGEEALRKGYETLKTETAAADRAWIARANKPVVRHPFIIKNYRRWLLANILHMAEEGAMSCGPRPFWGFAWPRDCSQQAAAFAAAGFIDEARKIVKWHIDNTPASGVHEARYCTDRAPMLLDNRPAQGDNPGFLCWAASFVCRQSWDRDWAEQIKDNLYLMAGRLVQSRDPETLLPLPSADYRETKIAESAGIAVTAVAGLKGAAFIADRLGDPGRAGQFLARAKEIKLGARKHLWNEEKKYFMTSVKPFNDKASIATCWGAYPFRAWDKNDPMFVQSVKRVYRDLWNRAAAGVLCSAGTPYESYWMYHAAILLLGASATGDRQMEAEILASLEKNIPPQGIVPEQVSKATGILWGCAPLPVAHADLILYAYRKA
jgi:hypothetical protein